MKKTLIIGSGVIFVLLLVALWVYVMFFGTPRSVDEVFGGFAGNDTPLELPPPPETTSSTTTNSTVANKPLRQLTTKPVIGFTEPTQSTSSAPEVYYAEAGTGHVFAINLTTGTERRISGTTIAEATRAEFSPNGRYVMIQSGYNRTQKVYLGEISTTSGSLRQIPFAGQAHDFSFPNNSTLLYSVKEAARTVAYALNLQTQREQTLFTIPFREAIVEWGSVTAGPHFVYPKPSHLLEGFLYKVENGVLSRLPFEGYGLHGFGSNTLAGTTFRENNTYTSVFYETKQRQIIPAPVRILAEKCSGSRVAQQKIWCASDSQPVPFEFPDNWYQGDISFTDSLYALNVDFENIAVTKLSDMLEESGRAIDAVKLNINPNDTRLYFVNKNDSTLWTYDLSL